MTYFAMFGTTELMLILLVVLILFGGTRIPRLLRGLGEGVREFRQATRTETSPISSEADGKGVQSAKAVVNGSKSKNV